MDKGIAVFTDTDGVRGALSLATAGNMKLRGSEEEISAATENQRKFLTSLAVPYMDFVYGHVVHGTRVAVATADSPRRIEDVDAIISGDPGTYVGITVADCFPVFFHDALSGVVGVAHAGWRGTVKGIIPATIEAMAGLGAQPENVHIEFGPGISQANFEFHYAEMIKEFGQYSQDKYVDSGSSLDKITIDLQAILSDQLVEAGVSLDNIQYCRDCTFADEKYFSARRHQGESHSAMLACIGLEK